MSHNNPAGPVHLDPERLAGLDHEPPTLDELAHLAACAACRAEREAYASLAALAAETGRADDGLDAPRLTSWERLSGELRREGLLTSTFDVTPQRTLAQSPLVVRTLGGADVHTGEHVAPVAVPASEAPAAVPAVPVTVRPMAPRRWLDASRVLRAAAAVVALAGSAAVGRLTATAGGAATAVATTESATDSASGVQPGVRLAAFGGGTGYASVDEATAALMQAQQEYERASLWLAGNDTTTRSSDVYRARLAALDQMMAASRAALRDAPQDPVLNHYFLAASTAREATLQQLGGALPVDKTIESY